MVAAGEKKGSIDTFWKCPWVNKKKKKGMVGGGAQNGLRLLREEKKQIKEAS